MKSVKNKYFRRILTMNKINKLKDQKKYKNINIFQIINYRLPPSGVVSIMHRISGSLIFFLLPFILYLLDQSLSSKNSYEIFRKFTSNFFIKILILSLIWLYLNHFFSGIRHLIMDLNIGLDKNISNKSAIFILIINLSLILIITLKFFGVI